MAELESPDWIFQVKNRPVADVRAFAFRPRTPGGSLVAATPATVTLAPVPPGVNGTDSAHYLYVSGGTGTAEAVLITGGTAVAGASTGTITFTPANNHTGAWTIQSATGGIQEAIIGTPAGEIILPKGTYNAYAPITIPAASYNIGGAVNDQLHSGTTINNLHTGNTFTRVATSDNETTYLHDMMLVGNTNSANGIDATNNSGMILERLWVLSHGGDGVKFTRVFYGVIRECTIVANKHNGINLSQCNDITIDTNSVNSNALTGSSFNNILSQGGGPGTENLAIRITNNDIETAGAGASIAYGVAIVNSFGVTISGNYTEGNLTRNFYLGSNAHAINFTGNYSFDGGGMVVDTASEVTIEGNYFTEPTGGVTITTAQAHSIDIKPTNKFANGAGVTLPGVQEFDGGAITSQATITLPNSGKVFNVTGTTGITSVTASWAGRTAVLVFSGILTVTDGSNLKLNGNLTTGADTTLVLVSDGVNWYELSRSVN